MESVWQLVIWVLLIVGVFVLAERIAMDSSDTSISDNPPIHPRAGRRIFNALLLATLLLFLLFEKTLPGANKIGAFAYFSILILVEALAFRLSPRGLLRG